MSAYPKGQGWKANSGLYHIMHLKAGVLGNY